MAVRVRRLARKKVHLRRRKCSYLPPFLAVAILWTGLSFFLIFKSKESQQLPTTSKEIAMIQPKQPHQQPQMLGSLRQRTEAKTKVHTALYNETTVTLAEATTLSPYAYMFLLGSIHEDRPGYLGFLYDVLISVKLLHKLGSTADIWVYTQLASDSALTELSAEDRRLLEAIGVHIEELPKSTQDSFANLVYDKFRALQMTQYRRVLFLDADTIPLVNMDYLFHLSDPEHTATRTILRPNMLIATRGEPCNAGMFLVQPHVGGWELVQGIVQAQIESARSLSYPYFDLKVGWGHSFMLSGDWWEGVIKKGTKWAFHAAHSDQGLLYYYAKYVIQDVSLVIGGKVQNWVPSGTPGKPLLEEEKHGALLDYYSPEPMMQAESCHTRPPDYTCFAPYRDFAHFMGHEKPWQKGTHVKFFNDPNDMRQLHGPHRLWFKELDELDRKLKMGLDVARWDEKHADLMNESPLGYLAKWIDHPLVAQENNEVSQNTTQIESKPVPDDVSKNDQTATPPVPIIAYALSFIKCGDFQSHSAGLTDASLVLRHSVHKISKRNPASGSKYDYKMYAIVHRDAEACSQVLRQTGFEVVVVDPPIQSSEIEGNFLRKHIDREWCCGVQEFIKLFAYSLPEEIIVHVDIDFAFFKPMDDLFNAMLYDKSSPEGQAARSQILLERPNESLPDQIDAYITRDWPQVAPGKFPPGYQAGFLVARRNPAVIDEMIDIIRVGNYTEGWGNTCGWGGKGYGGYVGAMAMQGLVAYYYDHVRPNTAVELNQCRYNHMGMDLKYRNWPNFRPSLGIGRCRNGLDYCEDCMFTEMNQIYSAHYTTCRKPWQCQATGRPKGRNEKGERASAINTDSVDLNHCLELAQQWHTLRTNLEQELFAISNDLSIKNGTIGSYRPDIFQGHCEGDGNDNYLLLSGNPETFNRLQDLYN